MNNRLYQALARKLKNEIGVGKYPVGSRLPAERELAQINDLSRPTVREAIIALEVQGLVEVRVGSGAHVVRLPDEEIPGFDLSAFEITEARLLFEADAAALAATEATEQELAEISRLVDEIAEENRNPEGREQADRAFHLAIAGATRNGAIYEAIERLWDSRGTSPEAALLHEKARTANIKPVVEEHTAVLRALEQRDPAAARAAMQAHLAAVIDSLLFATENKTVVQVRTVIEAKRARYRAAVA